MLQRQMRQWLGATGVWAVAWRLILAAVAYRLGAEHGPMVAGHSELWYFIAVFLASWAVSVATSNRIVRAFGDLVGKLTVVILYWHMAFDLRFWPLYAAASIVTAYVAADLLGLNPDRLIRHLFGTILKLDREKMPEKDARFWREPTTVRELGLVGALYIRGYLTSQPAYQYGCPVDDETHEVIPVLVAANRAGFFTDGSQTASDEYDCKAWVTGFADADTTDLLINMLIQNGALHFRVRMVGARADCSRLPVGVKTEAGFYKASDVESFYGEVCNGKAVAALLDSYQIVIEDPEVGNNARVWLLLEEFAAARGISFHPEADIPPAGSPVVLYTKSWIIKGRDVHAGVQLDQWNHEGSRRVTRVSYEGGAPDSRFRIVSISDFAEEDQLIDVEADYVAVDPNTVIDLPAWEREDADADA